MSTAVWKLIPKKQIGEIEFGADKKNVRKVLGKEYRPFRKSIFSKSTTDAYADYHVYYTNEGALEAIEFFSGVEVVIAGKTVFPGTVANAQKVMGDLKDKSGSFVSEKYSVGLYAPNDEGNIEAILVARDAYYE